MNRSTALRVVAVFASAAFLSSAQAAQSGEDSLTIGYVRARIAAAHGRPVDFAGKRLVNLPLDGLDLRGANFNHAYLLETSFRGANLAGASFVGAFMSATKFAHANARNAHFNGAEFLTTAEGAIFDGADFRASSGYLIAPQGSFVGANFAGARLAPDMSNQPMGMLHTIFSGANLNRANLRGANMSFADFSSATLVGANLRGATFTGSTFALADLRGADVTDANFARADLGGAHFANVRGRATMRGLATAMNRDEMHE